MKNLLVMFLLCCATSMFAQYNPYSDKFQVSIVAGVDTFDPSNIGKFGIKGYEDRDWMINVKFGIDFSNSIGGFQLTYTTDLNVIGFTSRIRLHRNMFRPRRKF